MKKMIRKQILGIREKLPADLCTAKSEKIYEKITTFEPYNSAKSVMVYIDFRNEVATDRIIQDLIEKNKKAIVPICVPQTKDLILSQLLDPKEELAIGTFGVREPKKEYIREIDPDSIDLIIVPGVAFDRQGYRIGYGGGYYDRLFQKLTNPVPSVAIAFDLQIIDKVPAEDFDCPVDYIITEKEVISCK